MNRQQVSDLICSYVHAWEQQDLDWALGVLAEEIVIVENDGSVYNGLEEFKAWFQDWHAPPNSGRVRRWQIYRILFDEQTLQAAVDWEFECAFEGRDYVFPGASLLDFSGGLITRIQEYRMDKDQHRPYSTHH
ncbi:MAG TPA: nuclear transport factor 2 family protein [Anaerolineaceae bacterium]|nr:nuclear transport factor 2 family protein [Anaerolineaceae bacterium]